MGLLDWTRNGRNGAASDEGRTEPMLDAREARKHGHTSRRELVAEIRHDEGLAKRRDQTGQEPDGDQHVRPEAPVYPKTKAPGKPFERGERIIADEPFLYGGKQKATQIPHVQSIRSITIERRSGMSISACRRAMSL